MHLLCVSWQIFFLICYIPVTLIHSSTRRCSFPNQLPSFHSALPKLLLLLFLLGSGILVHFLLQHTHTHTCSQIGNITTCLRWMSQSPWNCKILWILLSKTVINNPGDRCARLHKDVRVLLMHAIKWIFMQIMCFFYYFNNKNNVSYWAEGRNYCNNFLNIVNTISTSKIPQNYDR